MAAAGARWAAVAAVCLGLLAPVPAPAASQVTVRVEFYYGAAVAGGVGFFVWISGGWQAYLAGRGPADALVEISGRGVRLGLPLPAPWEGPEAAPGSLPKGLRADLVRLRF